MHEELNNLSNSVNRENEMYINRREKNLEIAEIILEIKNNGLEDEKTLNLFNQYCKNKKEEFKKENPSIINLKQ